MGYKHSLYNISAGNKAYRFQAGFRTYLRVTGISAFGS